MTTFAEPAAMSTAYEYRHRELVEPDWRRFPGWQSVTSQEWRSAQWQRSHCVKSIAQLRAVLGDLVDDSVYDDLLLDQKKFASMSMLLPPQMINTMMSDEYPGGPGSLTDAFRADPVRHYMIPLASDRRTDWSSHPLASRDSLHESEMWAVEGLTHRYPNKVLAELVATCPQYCGHCTRMDLVGISTPAVAKNKFLVPQPDRFGQMLDYLRHSPGIRDVVVSGGDVANVPWPRLESFVASLLEIEHIRDIRLASKALVGMPQHWLAPNILAGLGRLADVARSRGVGIALHTHANNARSITPLVAEASRAVLGTGIRDVRNQGVLLAGVNTSVHDLLDLCFALLDGAGVMPYYFYLCDMIPESEHWRISLADAQALQAGIMGYLPGFATPRIVCDVPYLGKRWVHQATAYDRVTGISLWQPNHAIDEPRIYRYHDPLHTLPSEGRRWWQESGGISR